MGNVKEIVLSALGHTWILDLDGTVVKHNGYKLDGQDTFLQGAKEFLLDLPQKDMVIFLTSRSDKHQEETEKFLMSHGIRYNTIIFGVPYGERILVNDTKPDGLITSIAVSMKRDKWVNLLITEDVNL